MGISQLSISRNAHSDAARSLAQTERKLNFRPHRQNFGTRPTDGRAIGTTVDSLAIYEVPPKHFWSHGEATKIFSTIRSFISKSIWTQNSKKIASDLRSLSETLRWRHSDSYKGSVVPPKYKREQYPIHQQRLWEWVRMKPVAWLCNYMRQLNCKTT